MPYKACDIAVIENPINPNEILLFGGYLRNCIYIYDRITDKFRKNNHDFKTLYGEYGNIKQVFVCHGMTKNTLIVLSKTYYSIFNCKTYQWDELNINYKNNMSHKYCHVHYYHKFYELGCSANKYKQYLIVSGQSGINIFDVLNQYNLL